MHIGHIAKTFGNKSSKYSHMCEIWTVLDQPSGKCPDYQVVLSFQVSLCIKGLIWDLTKCMVYADVLIFKCPH